MNRLYLDNLLEFTMISNISIIVYTTRSETCTAHAPPPPCNQNHLNMVSWSILLHIALDQR